MKMARISMQGSTASYYDTSLLRTAFERRVDFDRINVVGGCSSASAR